MDLVERVRSAGVVGAGGGGFPTQVKLAGPADTVIANGAECEPLLHKDAAVMEREADAVVAGMRLAMAAVKAERGIVGIKGKNHEALAAMRRACAGSTIRVQVLEDYYPAGDEFDLVHEAAGRAIPPGGIPLQVGVVVCNVETFANLARAADGEPVVRKTLTIAGAVREPGTFTVPIGTPLRACLAAAGGASEPDPVLCIGGVMMGETTDELDRPVTKTTGGAIVLGRNHPLIQRKLRPAESQRAIGKSACDQCRYCTEYCPRYLLGYAVEPHQVMRSLAFTATGDRNWSAWAALCCACGLCTLYACPEALYPKEACDDAKELLRRRPERRAPAAAAAPTPHPMRDGRRVPVAALMRRLQIDGYAHPAPWRPFQPAPARLSLPLKQSAGAPARALVGPGERVVARQLLAAPKEGELGATLHAPLTGRIEALTAASIVLASDA